MTETSWTSVQDNIGSRHIMNHTLSQTFRESLINSVGREANTLFCVHHLGGNFFRPLSPKQLFVRTVSTQHNVFLCRGILEGLNHGCVKNIHPALPPLHYATSLNFEGSSLYEVDFFKWPDPSSRTMTLASTQPLTEMSTRNLPGG
jgi:hypothetical protein